MDFQETKIFIPSVLILEEILIEAKRESKVMSVYKHKIYDA